MEDNIQTIIVVIISVFLLFIFPVYTAYEKKDDISYALAMRYTQDLVDEVRNKGYLSKYMYEDYRAKLKVTGNSYDIRLTHEYNRYDPIVNYYKAEDGKYILVRTTTIEEKKAFEDKLKLEAIDLGMLTEQASESEIKQYITESYKDAYGIDKIEETYKISTQVYNTDHILNVLNSERKLLMNSSSDNVECSDDPNAKDGCEYAYIMNVDDNFNVTIKNTNTTLATVVYNMVTANTLDDNTRIYVNYGGTILASKWYGDVDYAKMKHDNLTITGFEETSLLEKESTFTSTVRPTKTFTGPEAEYIIEFDVMPATVTELREKGQLKVANYSGYNFALGTTTKQNPNSTMSVSVGINGISIITHKYGKVSTSTGVFGLPKTTTTIQGTDGTTQKLEQLTKITDYTKLQIRCDQKEKLGIYLTSKETHRSSEFNITDKDNILKGLNKTITNPTVGVHEVSLGTATNARGTAITCKITIEESQIKIYASQNISYETTILSYPTSINEYVNVRIEVVKNENGNYIAVLYLDDEKVEESIELEEIPTIDVIGKTFIGTEERFFEGKIKNIKIYE